MPSLLPRFAVALIWLYQGLWCKILGHAPNQMRIVAAAPGIRAAGSRSALTLLGAAECVLAVWILSGIFPLQAAAFQTVFLLSMNAGGIIWARKWIPDPVAMLLESFVLLLLTWMSALQAGVHESGV